MPESYHTPEKSQPRRRKKFPPAKPGYKYCTACEQEKSFDEFHQMASSSDGYRPTCKQCRKEISEQPRTIVQLPLFIVSKVCHTCEKEKNIEEFNKSKSHYGGYQNECKLCRKNRNHQFRLDNIEKFREYDRSRIGNPERVARQRERRQTVYAVDGRYAETIKRSNQRHYQNNKMKYREKLLRYNSKKLGATIEQVDFAHVLERTGYWCYICESPIDPTIKKGPASLVFDHIVPIQPRPGEPQGTHSEENIAPAHRACNLRKSNIPFEALTPFLRRGV